MPRPHRYADDHTPGGHVFEIMRKVVAGTFLLRPDPALNALVVGEYAHGLSRPRFEGRIRIHELVLQSNHLHALCSASTAEVVEDFEEYVAGNLAKRIGWLRGWQGPVWWRRYSLSQVFPSMQRMRQRYLHSQGLPENLYASPADNPCVSSYKAWSTGKRKLKGRWLDAAAMRDAGVAYGDLERARFEHETFIWLHPLPIDHGKTKAELVNLVRAQGKSIIEEHAKRRREQGILGVLGAQTMRDASPFGRPRETKRGKAAPLAIGTANEVADFKVRHAAAGEQRKRLLAVLVRQPALRDYPEQAAMPSVLRAAIARANAEDLKAAAVLASEGHFAAAAAKLAATPHRRAWPDLPPAPVIERGAKAKKKPRAVRPKRRKPQPKPWRPIRAGARKLRARARAARVVRRLRSVRAAPLPPKVIELPGGPLGGADVRRYVVLWVRCCVGAEEAHGATLA